MYVCIYIYMCVCNDSELLLLIPTNLTGGPTCFLHFPPAPGWPGWPRLWCWEPTKVLSRNFKVRICRWPLLSTVSLLRPATESIPEMVATTAAVYKFLINVMGLSDIPTLWNLGLVRCYLSESLTFSRKRPSFPSPAWLLEAAFSTFRAVDDQFSSCGLPG